MDKMMAETFKSILNRKTQNLCEDFDVIISEMKEKLDNLSAHVQSKDFEAATSELKCLAQSTQVLAQFITEDYCKLNELQKLLKLIKEHEDNKIF